MAATAGPSGEAVPVDEDAAELQFPKEFELQTSRYQNASHLRSKNSPRTLKTAGLVFGFRN